MVEHPDGNEREADPAALRAGYERLRAAVLSERPDGFRLGHGVLLTRGMLAWVRAFGALAPAPGGAAALVGPAAGGPSAPKGDPAGADVAPLPDADQLVAVLAQMVLPLAA